MNKNSLTGLFLIILFFLLKGLYLIFIIPPWEAPDEPGHVAYVLYLYKYKHVPSSLKPYILTSISDSVRKNRKNLEAVRSSRLKTLTTVELFDRNETKLDAPILANMASNPPLYYIYLLPFYKLSLFLPSYWTIILLRVGSLLLGSLSLVVIFFISKKLFPASLVIPYLVTFFVSFQPMFSFISGIVNKDVMVVFAFLLFLYFAVNELNSKESRKNNFIYLTAITSLSPLIMPQLFILIPLYFILLFLKKGREKFSHYFSSILVITPSILWFLYKFSSEGFGYLSYSVQNIQNTTTPFWRYPIEFIQGKQPIGIFMSFWGFFGWLDVPMPKWTYGLYLIFICVSLFGYLIYRKKAMAIFSKSKKLFIFLTSAFIVYSLFIFVFDIQYFILSHKFNIHGRYLAPILPLLIMFLILGLFLYPKHIQKIIVVLTVVIFILVQGIAFVIINHHYYGSIFFPKIFLMSVYKF